MIKVALDSDTRIKIVNDFYRKFNRDEHRIFIHNVDTITRQQFKIVSIEEFLKNDGYQVRVFVRQLHNNRVVYLVFFDMMDYLRFI